MAFLADEAEKLGFDKDMRERILNANTAQEVLEMTQGFGIDLPKSIAEKAKAVALATLRGAPVAVEIIVTDRKGTILARL